MHGTMQSTKPRHVQILFQRKAGLDVQVSKGGRGNKNPLHEVAADLGESVKTVKRYLAILTLPIEVQELNRPRKTKIQRSTAISSPEKHGI